MSTVFFKPVTIPNTDIPSRSGGRYRPSERNKRVYELHGTNCHYCGRAEVRTVDHIVPKSKGGSDRMSNLVPCCRRCNTSKGTKDYDDFLEYRHAEAVAYSAYIERMDCL